MVNDEDRDLSHLIWSRSGSCKAAAEVGERLMGLIPAAVIETDLGVAGDFDNTGYAGTIDNGDAPQFDIIFGRDTDLSVQIESILPLAELGTRLGEDGFILFDGLGGRLVRGGPDRARHDVADVDPMAGGIARSIGPPAKDVHVARAALAAPGIREHDAV